MVPSTLKTPDRLAAGAPPRGRLIELRYDTPGGGVVVSCDAFPLREGWLDVPLEAWKEWDYVQLVVRPEFGARRAELVLSDLRGRYLRDQEGHERSVRGTGRLSQRLVFGGCGRGLSLLVVARAGRVERTVRIFMGLTAHGSVAALGTHNLRPPPARLGAAR